MSKLLMDEIPLMVQPKLAVKIGLNEAIFLQQLHYWLEKATNIIDGKRWVYNTFNEWQKQFPFWSVATIKRTISSLENKKLIIAANYNKMSIDRTKWYTIDYLTLENLENDNITDNTSKNSNDKAQNSENSDVLSISSKCTNGKNQGFEPPVNNKSKSSEIFPINEPSIGSNCTNALAQNDPTISASCTNALAQNDLTNNHKQQHRLTSEITTTTYTEEASAVVDVVDLKMKKKMLVLMATKYGIQSKSMKLFFSKYNIKSIESKLLLLEKFIKKGSVINNPSGWLNSALRNDYSDSEVDVSAMKSKQKAEANQKAQRRLELQRRALQQQTQDNISSDTDIESKKHDNLGRVRTFMEQFKGNSRLPMSTLNDDDDF